MINERDLPMRLFQNPVAAEVPRLKLQSFHEKWSLLASVATVLKEAPIETVIGSA